VISRLWSPLRQRIVLTAVAFTLVVTALVLLAAGALVTSEAEGRFEATCRLVGALVVERLEEPLSSGDRSLAARVAALSIGHGAAVAVTVFDRDHRAIAASPTGVPVAPAIAVWPADEDLRPGLTVAGVPAEARFQVVRRGGEVVGGVWLAVDRRPVQQVRSRFRLAGVLTAVGVLGLAWLAAALVAMRIARPLERLADTLAALGRGDYSTRHPVLGPEEFRRVARRVNRIAEQLEAGAEERVRSSAETERQLRERTRQVEQLNRLLRDIANKDPLTQLHNRLGLEMEMEKYLSLCRRSGQPLAVIMMDLDSFKAYNDTRGHAAGDTALVTVAAALKARSRASDVVARLGGDEFCIVIPFTKPERAVAAAEGFVSAVVDATLDLPRLDSGAQLGASAGVACFPADGDEGAELLARADAALYRAKAAGKGRVFRASPQEPAPQA